MPHTNKKCMQASEGDRGQRVSIEERAQGGPQSNTKCMRQGKGQVKKNNAKHENNEKAGKKEGECTCVPAPKHSNMRA